MRYPVILVCSLSLAPESNVLGLLKGIQLQILKTTTPRTTIELLHDTNIDLIVLVNTKSNSKDTLDLVAKLRTIDSLVPIVFITYYSSEQLVIDALKVGVNDYLKPPITKKSFLSSIYSNLTSKDTLHSPQNHISMHDDQEVTPMVTGSSPSMQKIVQQLISISKTDSTVLVTGETGTGKELAAQFIHQRSSRNSGPFICINCAAIPDSLVESELFGYESGAFTGAIASKKGLLESANNGTLFLDEIGDMTPFAQAKILRSIELKESSRLGGGSLRKLNFRVIAATNRSPEELMEENLFRKDLYYRLSVACVNIPPLRDRKEDLYELSNHFIDDLQKKYGLPVNGVTQKTMISMLQHHWPGNVRELRNFLEAGFIHNSGNNDGQLEIPSPVDPTIRISTRKPNYEKELILQALSESNWNKSETARKLNCSRMTLYRKIAKYNII